MSLWLMMMSCVTSLTVVVLLTTQGVCVSVCDEEWSVTYWPESTCAFVGSSVNMSCSYTYPSDLTITEVYWTKLINQYKDPPRLRDDPEYSNIISEDCKQGTKICNLRMYYLTKLDIGEYYCRITTNTEAQKWTGKPGIHLDIKDAPQTSVSISPHGNIQEGRDVTLTCTSTSDLPVRSYIWYKIGINGDLGTGKTYTIKHIRPEDSGWYCCWSNYECGFVYSSTHRLMVLYPPKNTRIESDPSGEMIEGNTVTLTCMSEADPPVHTYTWIKKSGAVELKSGKEKKLIFSKIRSEDRGEYLCQAANRIGQQDSPAVYVQVLSGEQSPAMTAVITVSVCGLLGLFCGVSCLCKKCKKEMLAKGRNEQDAGGSVGNTQRMNPNTIQMSSAGQSLNPNTTQPDAVYQNLNPNTIQPDAVYQSLDPNTIQPDAVYQSLDPNTTKPDAVYQNLNPNTTKPDAVYQSLDPNTIQPDAVYQILNPKP